MSSINQVVGIIKILEFPKYEILKNDIAVTRFRGQLPLFRNKHIVHLTFWGNLARDIAAYYQINDHIIVEGYISLRNNEMYNSVSPSLTKIDFTVLKVYPLYSNSNNSINLIN